jgi:polyisoprenoid-binding protein YceI
MGAMKKFLFIIFVLTSASASAADKYVIDPTHANVLWSINHMGFSNVYGTFTDVKGSIFYDSQNPQMSSTKVVINTRSLQTILPKLTEHLQGPDFFNTAIFPDMKFESTNVKATGKKSGIIEGNLTILGVTKPVKLHTKFNKADVNPFSHKREVGFSAESKIKRSDFGMKNGIPNVGDEVKIIIEVEAINEEDEMLDVR